MAVDNPSNLMPDQEIIIEGDAGFVPKASPSDAGKVLGVLNSSGDVGWVVDQSGTFIQQQSDYAENDPTQVTYIQNKPDLSVYATTSAVNTALAGKQDTISDLDTIRSGAVSGSTAVQPATLESYATTSAMNTALASKQDTISDLSTIRSGAEAGATAVQPSQLPSSDELVPSSTSVDAGKVLTVGNDGTAGWVTPSAGTVYTAGDGVDITSDVISADVDGVTIGIDSTTKKIKSLQTIPTKTSDLQNDSNFVVASSLATVATSGSYADLSNKPSIPAVDQTYNASSTNAQSGTAVAQAIASIPSASYSAGDGIKISSNTISADYTKVQSALDFGSDFTFENPTQYTSTTTLDARSVAIPTDAATQFTLPGTLEALPFAIGNVTLQLQVGSGSTWTTIKSGNYPSQSLVPADFYTNVNIPAGMNGKYIRWFCTYQFYTGTQTSHITIENFDTTANCFTVKGTGTLALTDPLPASTSADANKVLTVDSNGAAGWQNVPTPSVDEVPAVTSSDDGKVLKATYSGGQGSYAWGTDSDTTYTAGNMIAINANNSNAIGVTTTAGITDIQQVAALPANPVATVLYLIPET